MISADIFGTLSRKPGNAETHRIRPAAALSGYAADREPRLPSWTSDDVQVQSSWFPLYDRNPQTFVQNIFLAKPADYKKAVQRIYHAPGQASFIELPLVSTP